MTYIITSPCQSCQDGGCVSVCPVDCIRQGPDQFYINPDECIDCGACVAVCPAEAILHEHDLDPDEANTLMEKALHLFQELG